MINAVVKLKYSEVGYFLLTLDTNAFLKSCYYQQATAVSNLFLSIYNETRAVAT
jgi:hypothetical protein